MADPLPAPRSGLVGTHVTTFYSYKGGVGRSLLLANVGWLLASGKKVLLWDLDVEAPGLHRVPALAPAKVEKGFFDWLKDWREEETLASTQALAPKEAAALRRLVVPVPGRPNLSILPAFGQGADFARLYGQVPWRRLLVTEPGLGLLLFDAVVSVLGEGRDHVLIDSRTGITDIGGFLAGLLPHTTVLVGSYGHQSLEGLKEVKKALEEAGRNPVRSRLDPGAALSFVHVVSPVPDEEEQAELAAQRRFVWKEVMKETSAVEVPFDPRLLWSETLLATEDPDCPAGQAYGEVAARLSSLRSGMLAQVREVTEEAERYPPELSFGAGPELRHSQGKSFEARVKRLLELHGYQVEAEQDLGGNKVDLVASRKGGLVEECWWVECKDHKKAAGKEVLERLFGWISGAAGRSAGARGMVVARSFSPAALAYAKDHPELQVWTVEELERRLFDPTPYLHQLVAAFEASPLGRTYVRQRVLLEKDPSPEGHDLLDHALAWVEGRGSRLWLLLGDYGTGKSCFFQRLAYELAKRALEDPEAPFPIAVDLKEFPNATSVEGLLFEHLRKKAPRLQGDPSALLHLLSAGRCVLLLDSFDEMGVAAVGRKVEEQFR
ncbi:MAG: restriction endonuclease, partial [Acidobacteria bacterium]|nr:restriction endonuclease [Acidobacteriota bacterium]